ncbi:cytochrome P450 [Thalassobacillus pellis]|uniref:cytochrome P450 n=1 Tax=Thalassobacillus pellis TaxID=748008 RepID=UPI00196048F1|nr:cytochrome P450 [Thalassobacillus pellis]MBM7552071.1 fatty-acid peroxygenase [Thalassobacillus pellis]
MFQSFGDIPKEKSIDNSIALLKEGYRFIPNRCRQYGTDIFQTRLLGEKVLCMSGEKAAEIFYDKEKFHRKGAAPKRIQKTLFGENAIQSMDGNSHEHRKLLFMSLMTPDKLERLSQITNVLWREKTRDWQGADKVVLFEETKQLLCKAACKWAGVPLQEEEVKQRADDFWKMVDAFGAVGPRHWQGRSARKRGEKWIQSVIEQIRAGKLDVNEGTAAYAMAFHRDIAGKQMDSHMAAVELINVLRPIVAITDYIAFSVVALTDHPEYQEKIKNADDEFYQWFVQEVRRYYPFGPFLGARVRRSFIWNEVKFHEGTLVLMDVYGTNHDSRLWENPEKFHPERFKEWTGGMFDLIPQGGGDYYKNHRCPGEWITIQVMKDSLGFLVNKVNFELPEQDLNYSLVRMPSLPQSGVILTNISSA